MSAGTLTLTNNSNAVTGKGTAFTTELSAGDFIVVTVGGVPYTLPVKSVESDTELALVSVFTGPTQSGAAWSAVPRVALNMVTAALVAQSAEALRGLNYDKQNWQQVFSGDREITVRLPDGTSFSGPSWKSIAVTLSTLDVDYLNQLASQINQDVQLIDADKTIVVNTAERVSTDAQSASAAATGAKSSETKAAQSEINAESYQGLARQYALNPEDVPVMNGDYSAFHYSEKARKSAEESASHNPVESLVKSLNLSDLADRAAAWLNVRPLGSTPLAGDPVNPYDAATKRWVENLVGAGGGTGPTMNGVQNYGVGQPTLWHSRAFIPAYAVTADGQLLNRADWPELWAHAQMHTPISESDWQGNIRNRGKFSSGNGTTTFRVPDLNGVQSGSVGYLFGRGDGGSSNDNGIVNESALPNITGSVGSVGNVYGYNYAIAMARGTGVFQLDGVGAGRTIGTSADNQVVAAEGGTVANFDAALSSPVYGRYGTKNVVPNSFTGVWIIRASGGFTAANTSWSVINSDNTVTPGVYNKGGLISSEYKAGGSVKSSTSLQGTFRQTSDGSVGSWGDLDVKTDGGSSAHYSFDDQGNIEITSTTSWGRVMLHQLGSNWGEVELNPGWVANTRGGFNVMSESNNYDKLSTGLNIFSAIPTGYPTKVGFHQYSPGNDQFGSGLITVCGDGGYFSRYMFNIYGDITGSNKDGAFNYTKNGVSDINRKKLVQYTDGAQSYENVKKVKPVDFVYKTDERERKRRGIIVQDAQDDIDPEWGHAVENEIGETTIFLDNNAITMDTLLALKFAIDKIEHLEERLAKME